MTGSIACFRACDLISKLVQSDYKVKICVTPNTLKFVGQSLLEGLSHHSVFFGPFEPGSMDHISLARWADLILLCPATANSINKLSTGIGDESLGLISLANNFKKPYWIAPAMNHEMWQHPATQESIQKLKKWGSRFFYPEEGRLACGEVGDGRMQNPEKIFQAINLHFEGKKDGPKVLITAGGTLEPIDSVRSITNKSSGKTGIEIAKIFMNRGWDVTLLHASYMSVPLSGTRSVPFESFDDLESAIKKEMATNDYDAVIHLAAVSDFYVEKIISSSGMLLSKSKKINSNADLFLHLKRRPKLLTQIKKMSKSIEPIVIGFKLSDSESSKESHQHLETQGVDFLVHNQLDGIDHNRNLHRAVIYHRSKQIHRIETNVQLAEALETEVRRML